MRLQEVGQPFGGQRFCPRYQMPATSPGLVLLLQDPVRALPFLVERVDTVRISHARNSDRSRSALRECGAP